MRAQHAGGCRLCKNRINPGEEVSIFLRRWTHAACKAAEIARRVKTAGETVILPPVLDEASYPDVVGIETRNRRNFRRMKGRRR